MTAPKPRRESRRHPRVAVKKIAIRFRPGGFFKALFGRGAIQKASLTNCSEVGLRCLAEQPLEPGTVLSLHMEISFMDHSFKLKGKVLRCRLVLHRMGISLHEVAILLDHPDEPYRTMLKRLRTDPLLRQGQL